jgi:putative FmdB family regulatory protein
VPACVTIGTRSVRVPAKAGNVPTYQYVCTTCGHHLEAVQAFTDAALTECPACAGRLRKLFSSVGIVFKGSGFYRNDSRAATPAASDSDGTSAGATDSKTEAGSVSTTADSTSSPASSTTASKTTTTSKTTTAANVA